MDGRTGAGQAAASSELDGPTSNANLATPFVGRPRELGLFDGALRDAAGGQGRLILVGGEAGIGKTRLADEIARLGRHNDAEVLWGRCWESGGAPAFWPWIQIVRDYAARRDRRALLSVMHGGAAEVARLVPELREYFPELETHSEAVDAEQARFRQFDNLTTFLRRAAQAQPLLLIIDDLHWADQASLLLLQFLSHEISDARLLVLATYRTGEPGYRERLTQTLGDLVRSPSSRSLLLEGLGFDDIIRFIEQTAGSTPSQALVAALHEETEGNPLFVSEIVRLLMQNGQLLIDWNPRSGRLAVPETLRDVIRSRLDRISPQADVFLQAASVVGRDFSLHVVARVGNFDDRTLLSVMEETTAARLVQRWGDRIGTYRFSHALVRETIYQDLSTIRRLDLHRAVAEALESTTSCSVDDLLSALSFHYARALPAVDPKKVFAHTINAARHAVALLAYEEAIEHYLRALSALELTSDHPETFAHLLLELGDVQNKVGEKKAARETFRRAAEISRSLGSADLFARSALGLGGEFGVTGAVDTELIALVEEGIERFHGMPSPLHARLLAGLSIALHLHGGLARRSKLSEQAVRMARDLEDKAAELFALDASHYAAFDHGSPRNRAAIAHEILKISVTVGDREMELRGHLRLVTDYLQLGEIAAADREISHLNSLAVELRQPRYQWHGALSRATRAIMAGRFNDAEKLAAAALDLGRKVDDARAVSSFWGQQYWVHRDIGSLDKLEFDALELMAQYRGIFVWEAAYAQLLCESERGAAAQQLLRDLTSKLPDFPSDGFVLSTLCLLAETCARLEDRDAATLLYKALAPFAEQHVTIGLVAVFLGSSAYYRGLLSATMGDLAEAASHLAQALDANEKAGARPLAARTRCEYGKVLARLGREEEARAQLTAAIAEFEDMGMAVCLRRAREALGAIDPGLVRECETGGAVVPESAPAAEADELAVFRPDGDFWTVSFGGKTARLKGVQGFKYIAYLLARANESVYVMDLAVLGVRSPEVSIARAAASEESLHTADFVGREPIFDERARVEYRSRLRELAAERDEAERLNDYGKLERLDLEIDAVTSCLSAGSRPGRGARRWASPAERARVNVRNAIATALRAIGRHHEPLRRHLQNSIRTGAICSYAPEQPVMWQVAVR